MKPMDVGMIPGTVVFLFGGNGDGTLFYPGSPDRIGGHTGIPVDSIRLKIDPGGHGRLRSTWHSWEVGGSARSRPVCGSHREKNLLVGIAAGGFSSRLRQEMVRLWTNSPGPPSETDARQSTGQLGHGVRRPLLEAWKPVGAGMLQRSIPRGASGLRLFDACGEHLALLSAMDLATQIHHQCFAKPGFFQKRPERQGKELAEEVRARLMAAAQ